MLQAFASQHLPEKTAGIITAQAEEYGKKNARLDERIAGLKKAEKKAKVEAKAKKAEQTAEAGKSAKREEKPGKEGKKATATPTVSKTKPESPSKEQSNVTVTAKTGSKPEEKPTVKAKEQTPKVAPIPTNPVKPQSTAVAVVG